MKSIHHGHCKSELGNILKSNSSGFCEVCALSKLVATPINRVSQQRSTIPFQMIYSDLKGPFKIRSHGGFRYLMTFIDDYSRYSFVYFIKDKSNAFEIFKLFHKKEVLSRNLHIQTLRSDNGTEYRNSLFQNYFKQYMI